MRVKKKAHPIQVKKEAHPIQVKNHGIILKDSKKPRKFLPWLLSVLDSGVYKDHGTKWVNKEEGIFDIQWPVHYKRQLNEKRSEIFMEYQKLLNPNHESIAKRDYATLKEKFRSCIRKYYSCGLRLLKCDKSSQIRRFQFTFGIPISEDYLMKAEETSALNCYAAMAEEEMSEFIRGMKEEPLDDNMEVKIKIEVEDGD